MQSELPFCPRCTKLLVFGGKYPRCPDGHYELFNNPVPVVSFVAPYEDGIVCVKRGIEPFKGEWSLPSGYVEAFTDPRDQVCAESKEETNLVIRPKRLIHACKSYATSNRLILFYLAEVVSGTLRAGDDAAEAAYYTRRTMPKLCFPSHEIVVDHYWRNALGSLIDAR